MKNTYIFYWLDGLKNKLSGETPLDALESIGLGVVDCDKFQFWTVENSRQHRKNWTWDSIQKKWIVKKGNNEHEIKTTNQKASG